MSLTPQDQELVTRIREEKSRHGAVILCHNYQIPAIYEVADAIGDSLDLARQARAARAELIIFAGVRFMAETAKLLNPRARVILARPDAGCEMADMISAPALRARQAELGPVVTVAYVNTPAEVKAYADICCTSANALQVVNSIPRDQTILFVPDQNLAAYVARRSGRPLWSALDQPSGAAGIIAWPGFCYVHTQFSAEDVARSRAEHPAARVIVHPECRPETIAAADDVASTSGMLRLAGQYSSVVLGTEAGMCHRVRREHPNTACYPLRRTALCRNMKLTGLADVLAALTGGVPELTLPEDVACRARAALERMFERTG
ncbi:MAG: quinolinate synthase NadA [candidate division WOR-3 bacterium]